MERRVVTVSELNTYVKLLMEDDEFLMRVFVRGEISNFTNHYKTGHFYFSLKDESATVRAVMFRSSAMKLRFMPENGMRVLISGRVGVFPRDGQYQIYVDTMEPDGVGALYIAFEQLKRKLEAEGLFDESRKCPLPKVPARIGVITSPTGAAIRDILNILGRRFPLAEAVLYPALVQGASAAPDLVRGIEYFNTRNDIDVIIIGRGGGSIEDLWAFNDEMLARRIAASRIPVISAVGHETDFTLCDFAADMRAPTPSAAAELAVPEREELRQKLKNVSARLGLMAEKKLELSRERLSRVSQMRLSKLTEGGIAVRRERLLRFASARALTSPVNMIDDKRAALLSEKRALYDRAMLLLSAKKRSFGTLTAKLGVLDPLSVLSRGYGAVFGEGNEVIKSVSQVEVGDTVTLMLSDGKIEAKTEKIMPK